MWVRNSVRLLQNLLISIALVLVPVLAPIQSTHASGVSPVVWPVNVSDNMWYIESGYNITSGGNDHGSPGGIASQLYGLDLFHNPRQASTVVSPVHGTILRLSNDSSGNGQGKCIIIRPDGHPDGREVVLCHIDYGGNVELEDGKPKQQHIGMGEPLGTIHIDTADFSNTHLHMSMRQGSTPIALTGIAKIAGCSDMPADGSINQYSGSIVNGCIVESTAGGTWVTPPTPTDISFKTPGTPISLKAHGMDNIWGLDKINITTYTPGVGWRILNTATFSSAPHGGDATASTTMPTTSYFLVSFDVYSSNDTHRKAPHGVRKFCNPNVTSVCTHFAGDGDMYPSSGGGGVLCTTPPTTTASANGATPGNNGWWRSPVSITLSATAPCGGSVQTYYNINGGSQTTYGGPIAFSQEGVYTISFHSVDAFGNAEMSNSLQVKIDWTPPVTAGTATGPRDTNGIFRDDVTVGLNGTDNLSGVESNQYSRDGGTNWTTLNGNNNTFMISGNGVSRAHYRSQDVAGNLETAKDSGPIIINKYVMFSNGSGQSMRVLYGTTLNISGDIHSNGGTKIYGNTGSTIGTTYRTVEGGNTVSGNTSSTVIPPIQVGGSAVPMLDYPLSMYQSIATVVFPSDLKMDSVGATFKGIIYAQGNVTMRDVGLSGPVSIVATGTITDDTTDSTFQTNDPYNGVLLFAGKDIVVNSTGNRNLGLMYAPSGMVKIRATNLNLKGSLVGKEVEINGATTFTLSYDAAFAPTTHALPLTAMGLVAPTQAPPALPSVPVLSKPNNGATGTGSKPSMSWGLGTGAVGWQLQISTSSSFGTLVHDSSYLSNFQKPTLSSGTTYYWRVRSVNQAGVSAWSLVRSFRT
jgi:hypothetical protein